MRILDKEITKQELDRIAKKSLGDLVKGVVDVDENIIAIDAELHSDLEALLIENGSKQSSLWGINLYPELTGNDFIEFDSLINIRPANGNKTRGVDAIEIQERITDIVNKWIKQ